MEYQTQPNQTQPNQTQPNGPSFELENFLLVYIVRGWKLLSLAIIVRTYPGQDIHWQFTIVVIIKGFYVYEVGSAAQCLRLVSSAALCSYNTQLTL